MSAARTTFEFYAGARVPCHLPAFVFLTALFLCAADLMAQDQPAMPSPVQAEQLTDVEAPQALHLLVGRSLVITSPSRIKRVSLADPSIAEAIVVAVVSGIVVAMLGVNVKIVAAVLSFEEL